MRESFRKFLNLLAIPVGGGSAKFAEVARPWQWEEADTLSEVLAGALVGAESRWRGAYLCKPRGCDKTSSVARVLLWSLCARVPPFRGYCVAADKDQASLVLDHVSVLLRLNEWLRSLVRVSRSEMSGKYGGRVAVLSTDAASAWGLTPTFVVFDELSVWSTERHKKFFDAVWTSLVKNPRSACVILSNAGYVDTWQWELWCQLRSDPTWFVSNRKYDDVWLSSEDMERIASALSEVERRRLFDNEWVIRLDISNLQWVIDGSASVVASCQSDHCVSHVIGVDYGKITALMVVSVRSDGRLVLEHGEAHQGWDVTTVYQRMQSLASLFARSRFVVDQYQLLLCAELLRQQGYIVDTLHPTSGFYKEAFGLLRELAKSHRLVVPDCAFIGDEGLAWELRQVVLSEDGRIKGPRDRLSALLFALVHARDNFPLPSTVLSTERPSLPLIESRPPSPSRDPLRWRSHRPDVPWLPSE